MTTTTSVFLPDEQEHKTHKKPPQSARPNAHGSDATDSADPYAEIRKLNEHELKAAIKSVWKKHEELAKQDLAPLLYYLREQLRAQGARNDLSVVEKDRGFAAWVEENLDITRRTADRWCEWFAVEAGLKAAATTSRHVSKGDADLWRRIQDENEEDEQIAFNYSVPKAVHGARAESTTGDHVVAREFFPVDHRERLPKVPACEGCNREKSGLEHYLTAVLPFGARHSGALANLSTMVPKRLQRNAKLQKELAAGLARSTVDPSGETAVALPFDYAPMEQLFALIAKGLAWYHWHVLLVSGYSAIAMVVTDAGAESFHRLLFERNARDRVTENLGEDAFRYEGAQAVDDPRLTIWRLSFYGGVLFGGDLKLPGQSASQIIALTGPDELLMRLLASVGG